MDKKTKEKLKDYEQTLRFYANSKNYSRLSYEGRENKAFIEIDKGAKAREVLKK